MLHGERIQSQSEMSFLSVGLLIAFTVLVYLGVSN